jgi:hypothetical protein
MGFETGPGHVGFVVGQSGTGAGFLRVLRFPCSRRSLHQLLHNHPHVSSGKCTIGQCGRSAGTYRDLGVLKQRDLRNLNLGDLKKGPTGA